MCMKRYALKLNNVSIVLELNEKENKPKTHCTAPSWNCLLNTKSFRHTKIVILTNGYYWIRLLTKTGCGKEAFYQETIYFCCSLSMSLYSIIETLYNVKGDSFSPFWEATLLQCFFFFPVTLAKYSSCVPVSSLYFKYRYQLYFFSFFFLLITPYH